MDVTSLQFEQLDKTQIPLVNRFYKLVYKKGIAKKSDQVFVLRNHQHDIVCAARIKQVDQAYLLTGVATKPDVREKGLASRLIKQLLAQQTQPIYCFLYPHLQQFYQQLGFKLCFVDALPEILQQRYLRYCQRKPLLIMFYQRD